MKQIKLTHAQEKILKAQVFDANNPGPVLHDFHVVLDFVGAGVKAGGKYNLLPIDAILRLDSQLSHPLRLPLERPQLRSHPYLQGLHLLLRASGLTQVEGTGDRARLVVDAETFNVWKGLNPTEQYFALLEAWLLRGSLEMVGARKRGYGNFLMDCMAAWRHLSTQKVGIEPGSGERLFLMGIYDNIFHLALMDLFGLVAVQHPPEPVAPWAPVSVIPTPFGQALLAPLMEWSLGDLRTLGVEDEDEDALGEDFGIFQPLLGSYFPAWQNTLVLPETESTEGVWVFKASLGKVWRSIALSSGDTLEDLGSWILRAFDFDNDHLSEFTYRDRFGASVTVGGPHTDADLYTDEVEIGDLPLQPGESMKFLFDFGDNWLFTVKLVRIDPPTGKQKLPAILERHGKAPRQYPNEEDDFESEE